MSKPDLDHRLDRIEASIERLIESQRQISKKETRIELEEKKIEKREEQAIREEEVLIQVESQAVDELKKIEEMERSLPQVRISPLRRITYRDITKGMIGAFFGVVGHFAFVKGVELASHISVARATLILIVAFAILVLFLYFTGFRKITDEVKYKFLPLRAIVIYLTALTTVYIVLLLYGEVEAGAPFTEVYKSVATVSVLAILGAATADLIGREPDA